MCAFLLYLVPSSTGFSLLCSSIFSTFTYSPPSRSGHHPQLLHVPFAPWFLSHLLPAHGKHTSLVALCTGQCSLLQPLPAALPHFTDFLGTDVYTLSNFISIPMLAPASAWEHALIVTSGVAHDWGLRQSRILYSIGEVCEQRNLTTDILKAARLTLISSFIVGSRPVGLPH